MLEAIERIKSAFSSLLNDDASTVVVAGSTESLILKHDGLKCFSFAVFEQFTDSGDARWPR